MAIFKWLASVTLATKQSFQYFKQNRTAPEMLPVYASGSSSAPRSLRR